MRLTSQPCYLPFVFLPEVARSTVLGHAGQAQPYSLPLEGDFEYSQESANLYDELVHKYPAIAEDLADLLPSTTNVSGIGNTSDTASDNHQISGMELDDS